MHILVDITHPAHVHFYRNAIALWKDRGHTVSIVARRKDIAIELLGLYHLDYIDLGPASSGLFGLGKELIIRNYKLAKLVRRFKPDVMTGIGGIFIAQVGKLLGIPSVVFTDTENATISNKLTFPFCNAVVTPDCYEAEVPDKKHVTYSGYHELAYLHPKRFSPDPNALKHFNLAENEDFILLRLVGWGAGHDLTDRGFKNLENIVARLKKYGRILISSESDLPDSMSHLRLEKNLEKVIHLQYYARLFIGESATMASECACLGTPAIFVSTSTRGYTNEQGSKYDMVFTYSDPSTMEDQALAKADEILGAGSAGSVWREKSDRMLADKVDVTLFMADIVERYARA